MANNNDAYFNAALAAAAGGPNIGRFRNSTVQADYATEIAAATAFATEVDSLIATDLGVSVARANLLNAICSALLASRYIASATATDYARVAADAVAFYEAAKANLA